MKRDQEAQEKRGHPCLSTNRFMLSFTAYLDVIGIKFVEYLKPYSKPSAPLQCQSSNLVSSVCDRSVSAVI